MNPICYELCILIKDKHKDQLISILDDLGEHSFVEGALDCDVEFDYDYEHLSKDYYNELAQDMPLILYSEDLAHLEQLKSQIFAHENFESMELKNSDFSLGPIADQNWRESWRASFQPVDIEGIFVILPPWENPNQFAQKYKIIIDPGMAFGTGQHETTRLCLELYLTLEKPNRVLDVGTGSGILAIAACLSGSTFVLGNDIDPESVQIATENALKNSASRAIFTHDSIDQMSDGNFDLIFANIQIKPLMRIFPNIMERLSPTGKIIVSGILNTELDEFGSYLNACGAHLLEYRKMGHWIGILCGKSDESKGSI